MSDKLRNKTQVIRITSVSVCPVGTDLPKELICSFLY